MLVDDAIVVVENVKRLMEEDPTLSPRDATIESMREITMALIAIALVLSAVFVPMAFFGGSVGVIYKQFSVTLVSAMLLSIGVALVLTPALCAHLLKQAPPEGAEVPPSWLDRHAPWFIRPLRGFGDGFNDRFGRAVKRYLKAVRGMVDSKARPLVIYALIVALLIFLFQRLPTGFLPVEDTGIATVTFSCPAAPRSIAPRRSRRPSRTMSPNMSPTMRRPSSPLRARAAAAAPTARMSVAGSWPSIPWEDRKGKENTATGHHPARNARAVRFARCRGLRSTPARRAGSGTGERFHHRAAE